MSVQSDERKAHTAALPVRPHLEYGNCVNKSNLLITSKLFSPSSAILAILKSSRKGGNSAYSEAYRHYASGNGGGGSGGAGVRGWGWGN